MLQSYSLTCQPWSLDSDTSWTLTTTDTGSRHALRQGLHKTSYEHILSHTQAFPKHICVELVLKLAVLNCMCEIQHHRYPTHTHQVVTNGVVTAKPFGQGGGGTASWGVAHPVSCSLAATSRSFSKCHTSGSCNANKYMLRADPTTLNWLRRNCNHARPTAKSDFGSCAFACRFESRLQVT